MLYFCIGALGVWILGHIAICLVAGAYHRIIHDSAMSFFAKCREIAEYSLGIRTIAAAAALAFARH